MKNVLKIVLTLAIVLATFIFLGYKDVKVGDVKGFKVENVNLSSANFMLQLEVNNPNFYRITANDFDVNLQINEVDLGKINVDTDLVLEANSQKVYDIPVKIGGSAMLGGALSLLKALREQHFHYKVDGDVNVKVLFFNKKIEIHKKDEINM